MPKGGDQGANRNAEVKALMMAGPDGHLGGEQKLGTVDEGVEGSESVSNTQEPAEAKRELHDDDFAEKSEGSEEKLEADSAASNDKNEEDSETPHPVTYFFEDFLFCLKRSLT